MAAILIEGKNGLYVVVNPDLKKGKLVPTKKTIHAKHLVLFGFKKKREANPHGYEDESNFGKTLEEIRLRNFKSVIDLLKEHAKNAGLEYILVSVTRDAQGRNGRLDVPRWIFTVKYQFLVEAV